MFRSLSKIAASAALIFAATHIASAADLPAKAPGSVARDLMYQPAPIANWQGFYLGLHVGAGWGTVSTTTALGTSAGVDGMMGGVQVGYNWQFGNFVTGLEGTFSGTGIDGTAPCAAGFTTCSASANWLATITGRVGVLVGSNVLAYVKGGVAWKDTDYTLAGVTVGDTRTGWLFGTGLEYGFMPNWTAFIEYNFMDFGRDTAVFVVPPTVTADIEDRLHVVKAGMNWKFNSYGGWR